MSQNPSNIQCLAIECLILFTKIKWQVCAFSKFWNYFRQQNVYFGNFPISMWSIVIGFRERISVRLKCFKLFWKISFYECIFMEMEAEWMLLKDGRDGERACGRVIISGIEWGKMHETGNISPAWQKDLLIPDLLFQSWRSWVMRSSHGGLQHTDQRASTAAQSTADGFHTHTLAAHSQD